jgi:hypothetical protein
MFTQPKTYDLNVQTDARRRMQIEHAKRIIEQTSHYPTVVEPSRHISQNPNLGTPASALSIKQRQQALKYQNVPAEPQM